MDKNTGKMQQFTDDVMEAVKTHAGDINTKMDLLQGEFELEQQRNDALELKVNRGGLGGGPGPGTGLLPQERNELNQALRTYLKTGKIEGLMHFSPQSAMEIGSDPGGGWLVVPEFEKLIGQIIRDRSPFRQVARIRLLNSGDAYEETYSKDAAGAEWVAESEARPTTSTPGLFKLRIPLREIYAQPEASQRIIDDSSYDITGWLTEQVGIAFAEAEGTAFITGIGLDRPRGLLDYPTAATPDASRDWQVFEHIATTAAGSFGSPNPADQLVDVVYSLKSGYKSRAAWMMNSTVAGTIRRFKDGDGRYLWTDSLVSGQPPMLLGYPVVLNEDLPNIAANSLSIVFGDFQSGYTIVDRAGIRLLVDPFTNKPQVRLYSYKRVGGDCRDFNSVKFLKFSVS
ncbi:MAG: phage major capsid protein [Acidobacteria bacterium]|nr:MAG: phage major capsid protein [Acidobacteriota bacterium]